MKTKTVNQVSPAYTYYLEANLRKITKLAKKADRQTLVNAIEEIIEPAMDTYTSKAGYEVKTKKTFFKKVINSPDSTNDSILNFVNNSIKKARRTPDRFNH